MEHLQFCWPKGWRIRDIHWAVLAVRQHGVPDFSAGHQMTPAEVRQLVDIVDQLSEMAGQYIFDASTAPEPWQPAPHIPRAILAALLPPPPMDFQNAKTIIARTEAGQGEELLYARACRTCGDIIEVSYKFAARICKKHKLARYTPPSLCWVCAQEEKQRRLQAPVGEQHDNAAKVTAAQPGTQPEKSA
jgi:hypothetical protein